MNKSGIVRKIDELGRIVIPKEIRSTLGIKNGDELEISVDNDLIILKKYYRLREFKDYAKYYTELFNRINNKIIFICDNENILVAPSIYKSFEDNKISSNLYLLNNKRETIKGNILRLSENLLIEKNYYFVPIINNIDVVGSVILFSDKDITETDAYIVELLKLLLSEKLSID